jgi:hypothetical protein
VSEQKAHEIRKVDKRAGVAHRITRIDAGAGREGVALAETRVGAVCAGRGLR